jgi:carbamoyltransferase
VDRDGGTCLGASTPAVIGFGGSGHDWSACILRGDHVELAIEEERICRLKHGIGARLLQSCAVSACLSGAGLTADAVDYAVACDLVPLPLAASFRNRLIRIRHHLAHAFGAAYSSPFTQAAVLIADNSGSPIAGPQAFLGRSREVETLSYFIFENGRIEPLGGVSGIHCIDAAVLSEYYDVGTTDNSLGHLYWIASELLGFLYTPPIGSPVSEDGKTMGLSSYGDERYVEEFQSHLRLCDDGQFELKLVDGSFREHMKQLLPSAEMIAEQQFAVRAALAKAVQRMLERALIHCARHLRKRSGKDRLVFGGGVALNCLANTRIAREAGFCDVYILPAAGDAGNALGAAVYGLVEFAGFREPRIFEQLPFLGPRYSEAEIHQAVTDAVAQGAQLVKDVDRYKFAAESLAAGKIVAWFEGRSEFGPRALGNRSLLADPRRADSKERLNRVIKQREPFRPFAPMVLAEHVHEVFEMPDTAANSFMLMIANVRGAWAGRLPAVTHVDGTARVQTVDSSRYASMHRLLKCFQQLTDVPVLLNTSFNRAGQPLVESPSDAVKCFLEEGVDMIVLYDSILLNPMLASKTLRR